MVPRQHSTQCISHLSLSCCIMTLLPLHKVVLDVVNSMVLWPATLYNPGSTEWRVPGGNPVYSMGDAPELYRLYDETSNKTKGGLMVNQYGVEACEWKVQRSSLFSRARACVGKAHGTPHTRHFNAFVLVSSHHGLRLQSFCIGKTRCRIK